MTQELLVQTALQLISNGYELIPLHPNDKKPIGHWRASPALTEEEIPGLAASKHNIGLRLREHDLLIDVDVKNESPGELGLRRLQSDVPELTQIPYATQTASKGLHYLLQLPEWFDGNMVPYVLDRYPGIQFLSIKRQALIAGCELPNGKYIANPAFKLPPPMSPDALVDILLSSAASRPQAPVNSETSYERGWGVIEPDELAKLLTFLPATDYGADTENMWFDLMCACHYVTAGTGLQEFIEWSETDPMYEGHAPAIAMRWRSLDEHQGQNPITAGLLMRELRRAKATEMDVGWFYRKVQLAQASLLMDKAQRAMTIPDVMAAIREGVESGTDDMTMDAVFDELRRRCPKITKTSMRKARDQYAKELKAPVGHFQELSEAECTNLVLRELGGNEMLVLENEEFYLWNGRGAYEQTSSDNMGNRIKKILERNGQVPTYRGIQAVRGLLRSECYVSPEFWKNDINDGRMFNMENGELWLTSTGLEIRPHNLKSRRRITLPISYDSDNLGLPETWLRYMQSAFHEEDLATIQNILAIGICYSLTESRPWLKKCFFLDGPPDTGKSVVLDLLRAMCGPGHSSELTLDDLNSRFGPSRLLGKLVNTSGEVSNASKGDPMMLKALIAGDTVHADRKGVSGVSLTPTSVFWMAGNVLPRFVSGASGLLERFCFIPYHEALKKGERDDMLLLKLIQEIPDIFHWALPIYVREWQRDRCRSALDKPLIQAQSHEEMLSENVLYREWLEKCLEYTNDMEDWTPTDELYTSYTGWQAENPSAPFPVSKQSFSHLIGRWLKEMPGSRVKSDRGSLDGVQMRGWRGVRVLT